jgi:hypothetical protein
LISTAFSINDILDKAARLGKVREEVTANNFNQIRIEQNDEIDQKRAAIANARMKRGCVLVVDSQSAKNLVTLVEGQPVRDRVNKSNLSQGLTVCGANGETAVLRNNKDGIPVISDIAVGDRELVYKNLSRIRGAKVFYNTPVGGGN